jgi:hypothetical protein
MLNEKIVDYVFNFNEKNVEAVVSMRRIPIGPLNLQFSLSGHAASPIRPQQQKWAPT